MGENHIRALYLGAETSARVPPARMHLRAGRKRDLQIHLSLDDWVIL